MTTKSLIGWTAAATLALAMTAATSSFACDQHAQAADAKDAKAVAATGGPAGCDKPCCAKKATADPAPAVAAAPGANTAAGTPCDAAKSADGKSCPKKAALVAKAEPAKEAPKAEPTPNNGANR